MADEERAEVAVRYGWSLAHADWQQFEDSAARLGLSEWRRVALRPLDKDSVPTTPGVYLICTKPSKRYTRLPAGLYDAIYVGQATSLRNRFLQHCAKSSDRIELAKSCFKVVLDYWYVETVEINAVESLLIKCLGPSANVQGGAILATIGNPRPAGR